MTRLSNRHEGDLKGQLRSIGDTEAVEVTVLIPPETAMLASTQHTAWMLINLLCRQQKVIKKIGLVCPSDVPLAGRIVPLASRTADFRTALLAGSREIGGVSIISDARYSMKLSVGSGTPADGSMNVYGEGWWGGISSEPISGKGASSLPFGPYIAACIAAGEVFKAARMHRESYVPLSQAFYSAWDYQSGSVPNSDGPDEVRGLNIEAALAGVGAVGSVWMHALWAVNEVHGHITLADNDRDGVDETNLNRYALFGVGSLGHAKATEAARIAGDANIQWAPFDGAFEELPNIPAKVISAVDNNRARQAIQLKYPALILSASTLDLRAEVLRCGPPGEGACLRCFNPLEEMESDDAIRARLSSLGKDELSSLSAQVGISSEQLQTYIKTGRCGVATERLLPFLRQAEEGPQQWSVGFVSAMAGTLLAAQTVKDCLAIDMPLSDTVQRAVFQFWNPISPVNAAKPYWRDAKCQMCNPRMAATQIWRQRFDRFAKMAGNSINQQM